jgi:glycosyltransferase involved in cell wall biosynthesis
VKILFLDQFSEIGGGQRVLLDVVDAVAARGWMAHVLVPGNGPLAAQLRSRNVAVEPIPCGPYHSGGKSPADFFQFAKDVRQQVLQIDARLQAERFDLVYVNGPRLLSATSRAVRDRAPVWFHAHSRVQQSYAVRAAGSGIRRMDAVVVACSNWAAQPLRAYVSEGKLHVIPNGAPDLGFRDRTFDNRSDWSIGVVGRISPEKGQMEFLRAVALLKPEFPRARFFLCGAASPSARKYFARVQALASDLNVQLLGWREDVASVFSYLDLLVVPSKEEAMGRVLVEAFAAGVPVIAFPAGGIPEVVVDNKNGFLVNGTTPEALAARIRNVLNGDPQIPRRISLTAREVWLNCYTVAAYQQRITNLMAQVVATWQVEHETGKPLLRK